MVMKLQSPNFSPPRFILFQSILKTDTGNCLQLSEKYFVPRTCRAYGFTVFWKSERNMCRNYLYFQPMDLICCIL